LIALAPLFRLRQHLASAAFGASPYLWRMPDEFRSSIRRADAWQPLGRALKSVSSRGAIRLLTSGRLLYKSGL
jgi:hypothetical protein